MPFKLPHDQQEFLEHLVAEGKYASVDQTMLDTIMLLERRKLLRAEVQQGLDDVDAGKLCVKTRNQNIQRR